MSAALSASMRSAASRFLHSTAGTACERWSTGVAGLEQACTKLLRAAQRCWVPAGIPMAHPEWRCRPSPLASPATQRALPSPTHRFSRHALRISLC